MSNTNVRRLLSAIVDHYRSEVRSGGEGYPMLSDALQAIASTPYPRMAMRSEAPPARVERPVCRFIADIPSETPLIQILDRFKAAEPFLDWLQNPAYTADRMGADFVDRYGYVEIVGPGRMFRSQTTLVGLLLIGPGVHYPDHLHPAEEVYHVVAGCAEWWREGGEFRPMPAGSTIHHPSGVRHAMRTAAEPLLALYCWRGDIEVGADLTGSEPAAPKARAARKRSRS